MKKCRITVIRISEYRDLMEIYEYPMENACDMHVGQTFIANGWKKPEGLCESAWETMSPFVLTLACGGRGIYGKRRGTAGGSAYAARLHCSKADLCGSGGRRSLV